MDTTIHCLAIAHEYHNQYMLFLYKPPVFVGIIEREQQSLVLLQSVFVVVYTKTTLYTGVTACWVIRLYLCAKFKMCILYLTDIVGFKLKDIREMDYLPYYYYLPC